MSKRKNKQPCKPRRYVFKNLEKRAVTQKDKWCLKPQKRNNQAVSPEEWGYILTLPNITNGRDIVLEGFEGYTILRTKKLAGNFLLQIVKASEPKSYGISSKVKEIEDENGKNRHPKQRKKQNVLTVRNLEKRGF
ncbi:MAG: hypothetical protein HFJ32_00485 [Clostridia bacterium]|nr:hypothetical protein [Clostridia bacterium]